MKSNDFEDLINEGREEVALHLQNKWVGSKNENLKKAPPSTLGNFGEDLIVKIFKRFGHEAERVNKGIGEFDILVDGKITLEGKTATEDTKGGFQHNGIKKNGAEYDYVICLGVGPNDFYINMWSKEYCVDNLTTTMTKDAPDGFKLSSRPGNKKWPLYLLNEENFDNHIIKEIV
tara:strand:+ start:1752 stop:2276 length:525 start_codon:yes stop_codon:yes gene_type:complete